MCYVHADWLNMTGNENIFSNTGLGCQPKYSWINPKNDGEHKGRKGYAVPCSRVCGSKTAKFKEFHQRVLVQSDLPGLGLFGTTLVMKTPSCVFLENSLISDFFVACLGFFDLSKWQHRNKGMKTLVRASSRCGGEAPCSAPAPAAGQPVPSVPISHKLFMVLKV